MQSSVHRIRKRRHGPLADPASQRQRAIVRRETNKAAKTALMLSRDDCIWITGSKGGMRQEDGETWVVSEACCNPVEGPPCSDVYDATTVRGLRRYYHSLDATGKRQFLAQRTSYGEYDASRPLGGQSVMSHCLEHPHVLAERLGDRESDALLQVPTPGELRQVCKRFQCFATYGHNDTTYDHYFRKEKGPALKLDDINLSNPRRARAPVPPRPAPAECGVIAFLQRQGEACLHLPNDPNGNCILPWPSRKATHEAYVREEEERLRVHWKDHDVAPARKDKSKHLRKFRYGNTLCGLKGAAPEHNDIASYAHFCRVWCRDEQVQHILIRKWLPFAKCASCSAYRDLESRVARGFKVDPAERIKANDAQRDHLHQVKLERRHYYSNRLRAELDPSSCMSLIIDGADQSKYAIPYHHIKSHGTDESARQPLHAYGVISHGRKAYTYLLPSHVRQGHDVTIDVLWRVICDTQESEGKLPPVLYLQLDNTTKQNKGRYLFAFLALLVHHGVFERICVSFLPVGHTHEDIDQMFSKFAMWLRGHDALDRADMAEQMRAAYTYNGRPPDVEVLDTVAGMSEFLADGTGVSLPECMDHRHFRVRRNTAGKVIIQARSSPVVSYRHEPWQGLEGNTLNHDPFPNFVPDFVAR